MKARFVLRRRVFAVGVVAAVAVVVAAGYGWSAITAGDQVYTGCLQSGSITNVAVGPTPLKARPKNALQISWNQQGQQGIPGTNGTSVNSATEPVGVNCANGGSKFTAANGVTYACNGGKGDKGDIGPAGPGLSDISQLDGTPVHRRDQQRHRRRDDGERRNNLAQSLGNAHGGGSTRHRARRSRQLVVGMRGHGVTLACDAVYYNADALVSNGCETQPDPWPDSFATASNQGTLNRWPIRSLRATASRRRTSIGSRSRLGCSLPRRRWSPNSNLFRGGVNSPYVAVPDGGNIRKLHGRGDAEAVVDQGYSLSSTLDGSNYALTLASI